MNNANITFFQKRSYEDIPLSTGRGVADDIRKSSIRMEKDCDFAEG